MPPSTATIVLVVAMVMGVLAPAAGQAAGDCEPLTKDQQVAQVLGLPVRDPVAGQETMSLAADTVGTVVLLGAAIQSGDQVRTLITAMDEVAPPGVPPIIAVDEEGGRVARFGRSGVATHLPSARTQAQTMTPDQVADAARDLGQQMATLGVDLDLAPVLDMTDADAGTVIGDRSFSTDPTVAGAYATGFARGLREAGIATSGKHFPDHGMTTTDTHQAVARVEVTRDRLATHHLQPYRTALAELDSIMLSHLRVSSLDPELPASLSATAVTFLRDELDYDGPLLTDDLSMQAVASVADQPTAALMALQAGVDLMLAGTADGARQAHSRISDALDSGELPADRLRSAVRRVLGLRGITGPAASCLLGIPPITDAIGVAALNGDVSLISNGQRRRVPDEETRAAYRVDPVTYSLQEIQSLPEGPTITTVRRYTTAVVAAPGTDAVEVAVARSVNQHGPSGAPVIVVAGDTRPWVIALAAVLSADGVPILPPVQSDAARRSAIDRVVEPAGVVHVLGVDPVEPAGRMIRQVPTDDPVTASLLVQRQNPPGEDAPLLVADPALEVLRTAAPWIARHGLTVLYSDPAALDPDVRAAVERHLGPVFTLGLDPVATAGLAGQALPTNPEQFANWAFRSRQMSADLIAYADGAHLLAGLALAAAAGAMPTAAPGGLPQDLADVVRGWGLPTGGQATMYLAGTAATGVNRLGIPVVYGRAAPR